MPKDKKQFDENLQNFNEKLQKLIHNFNNKDYVEGNLNYIQDFIDGKSIGRKHIEPTSILGLKMFLNENNFCIRV